MEMVLHAQCAGLASLGSRPRPPPPRAYSRHGGEFLPRHALVSSFLSRSPNVAFRVSLCSFHLSISTRRLSISATAAGADSGHPNPSEQQYPYEKSIFLHILHKFPVGDCPQPAQGSENAEPCNAGSVGFPDSGEGYAEEEIRNTAVVDYNELGDGGGKEEKKERYSKQFSPFQEEQNIQLGEGSFPRTVLNFDTVDPPTDELSGRTQRLKVGRQVFRTGEQEYKRWMPRSAVEHHSQGSSGKSPTEEEVTHSIGQNGDSAVSLHIVGGYDEIPDGEQEKEIDLQEEEVKVLLETSNPSEEANKDLLVEFLKKQSEQWGDTTRTCVGDKSVVVKTHVSEQKIDPLSIEEFHSSQISRVLTDDGKNTIPTGLIEDIVKIAKSLPPNASLETFLTPFTGQISTNDGNVLLRFLGENHLTWPMLSFFQWMRVHVPCLLDSRSFCTLFTYLGRLGKMDQALSQYENMPEDKAFHCVQVYNSLLGALSRSGRPEKIPIILQEMERRNIERDAVTYSILITATKRDNGRYDTAWTLFDDLLREGVKPSVSVYGSLIKAFCDEGHLKQALLVSLSMEKIGISPNLLIYNMLIDAHAKASKLEEAEGLLLEMKERGLHPTESTYNALINGYGKTGQLDVAEELVLEMQKEGLRPNVVTYTALMSGYGKHLSSERAANVFYRMRKGGIIPNTQTYTVLINAYAEGGWHDKAQSAFDTMLREGLKPTIETYTALLDGYRRAGDLDMVRHVWTEIKDDGCEVTKITYRTIMDAFAKRGLFVDARDVMEEFRKRGLKPDTMIFNMLLNAYARGGVSTKLRKVMLEMKSAGCEPDCFTYCTLIYSSIRLRDFKSAFSYNNEMLENGLIPEPKIYGKIRSILDAKYKEKLENDRRANAGQDPEGRCNMDKKKNPQKAKRASNFKRYEKKGPRRGSERTKALWKEKEKQALHKRSYT